MQRSWCVLILSLTLALLPAPILAQSDAVHAWEGTITIPTYKLGPADPNPPFPLVQKNPVYPYTMLDDLTSDRAPMTYQAIYLENKYLKITILPQLGGHVYSVYDKIDHREVLYRDHVIKYGLVGPRGAWVSGGMEFSFPFAHTTDTVSPVESVLHQNADGSATAVVGAMDWVSNMHWEVAITLRPDTARVEEGVTLFNATPKNHLYLFWTNTAVKAHDDTQYIYPMRETVSDDAFAVVESWPVWKGVDQSWYKNDPGALAIFGRDVHRNFFGVYYHSTNNGVVHVADYRKNPGKKLWTWGTARSGKIWDKILSDNDGSYNEIQSGRFFTQGSREFMNPQQVEQWTEYWYPVTGLDGGFVEATSQMAINTTYLPAASGSSQVKLTISPVAEVADATVVVKQGPKLLQQFAHVHLTPLEPVAYTLAVADAEQAKKDLNVQIQSADGKVLLQWSAAEPIDGNPDLVPAVGKRIKNRITVTAQTPIEELFLHGVFLEKTERTQEALKVYDQVLERDPGYVPALVKEAWYDYSAVNFKKAEALLQRAVERDNDVHAQAAIAYAQGVNYRASGQLSLAKNSFWTSTHYGDALAPGASAVSAFVQIGEISIHQKKYAEAAKTLEHAVALSPGNALALADLAVAERLQGNLTEARQHATEAVEKMPLLPYALAEQWLDSQSDASSPQAHAAWTKVISSDPENYLAVASWYHTLGAWESSDAVLHAAIDNVPAADVSPMIYYYLASNAHQEGKAEQAKQYAEKAASISSVAVFPNRITDALVLAAWVRRNPADAHAKYALGNFLFAHARYDDAADLWQKAETEGLNTSVLLRNLGVYQWRIQKDLPRAGALYARAIQISPNDYRLYTDLDSIYAEQANTAARKSLFQHAPAAVLDQDTVRAHHALFLIEQKQPEQALALLVDHHFKPWEGGQVVHDMYVVANMEKGKAALDRHDFAQAEQDFRQAMLYPENLGTGKPDHADDAEQLYWIGNALAAQGKPDAAKTAWTQATAHHSIYSALAYKKLGQDEKAQQILDRYIQMAKRPGAEAPLYYFAGEAERYSGNVENARKYFKQALELNPLFWRAQIELQDMNQVGGNAK